MYLLENCSFLTPAKAGVQNVFDLNGFRLSQRFLWRILFYVFTLGFLIFAMGSHSIHQIVTV
jgi:hypothetical protein